MGLFEDYQHSLERELAELHFINSLRAFERAIAEWLEDVIYPEEGEEQCEWDKGYCKAADQIKEIYVNLCKSLSEEKK